MNTGSRRSPILDASLRYWAWFGRLLQNWGNQIFGAQRRRSWFVFGGCFTWIFVIAFVVFAYLLAVAMLVGAALAFTLVGSLLSLLGGIDQLRLNILRR